MAMNESMQSGRFASGGRSGGSGPAPFCLPAKRQRDAECAYASGRSPGVGGGKGEFAAEQTAARPEAIGDDVRVLVVDDAPDEAEPLAAALRMDGYRVHVAHGGLQALDLVGEVAPHCVLLDIHMPGFDGQQLARRLRARYGDDIVLIAVTGWDLLDPRVSDVFRIVDHYLIKPVDPELLRRVLPRIRDDR